MLWTQLLRELVQLLVQQETHTKRNLAHQQVHSAKIMLHRSAI